MGAQEGGGSSQVGSVRCKMGSCSSSNNPPPMPIPWEPIEKKNCITQTESLVYEDWYIFKFRLDGEVYNVVLMRCHFGDMTKLFNPGVEISPSGGTEVGNEFKIGLTEFKMEGTDLLIGGESFSSRTVQSQVLNKPSKTNKINKQI